MHEFFIKLFLHSWQKTNELLKFALKSMGINTIIEILSVVFSLIFLVLVIRENIWCWIFGIISSILSVVLFYQFKLYSEAILYVFYAIFGVYGWYIWYKQSPKEEIINSNNAILDASLTETVSEFKVSVISLEEHLRYIVGGALMVSGIGSFFEAYTDAANPYFDAFTSVFGLIATYLEAHKILSAWIFWIILNGATVYLYYIRGLDVYAGLMVVYFIMSFVGYYQWRNNVSRPASSDSYRN